MAEYIGREALLEYLRRNLDGAETADIVRTPVAYGCKLAVKGTLSFVETAPAADVVEVRHGKWVNKVYHHKIDMYVFACSLCLCRCAHSYKREPLFDYCPNCGAKMDGKGEGE